MGMTVTSKLLVSKAQRQSTDVVRLAWDVLLGIILGPERLQVVGVLVVGLIILSES